MSHKKGKLDLLVRVRYSNPLPAPPFPPKLLTIPTDPLRYARPEFLSDVANDTPLPMIVDAELGMPLDLSHWDCLWDNEGADDSELNPDPHNLPPLDPKDQFLLGDPASGSYSGGLLASASGTSTPVHSSVPNVTWLRKTEYISREHVSRTVASQESKQTEAPIDVSRSAQIRDIESSFAATENFDLASLRHPNKPNVTAVDSYEILPDAEIWANAYDLFRFSERPGERPVDVDDPRLDCAILRPMESDGDHFLAYYLTKEDEPAVVFKRERLARDPDAPEEDEATNFYWVRDYEVVKVEQEVPNEFLLTLYDGDDEAKEEDMFDEAPRRPKAPKAKGAYYKNIERKMLLKKKRANAAEAYLDKWDIVKVTHVPMSKEEEDEREDALAEVNDPMYLLGRGDADAEGEIETEDMTGSHKQDEHPVHVDAVDVFGEE
ncbi:hypothetical protein K474DRAFT_1687312 [Panus rudis PR-1116 ss-1]|nr:hypothetical protein K474DRAFT_1687312 [Panus rudis PR-1116 ss-1]